MGTSFGLVTIESLRVKFSDILINGETIKKVIAANDIEGWVEVIDRLDPSGEAITHRVYGDISLIPSASIRNLNTIIDKISIVADNNRKIVPITSPTFTTTHIYIPLTIEESKVLGLPVDLINTNPCIRIEMPKVDHNPIGLLNGLKKV